MANPLDELAGKIDAARHCDGAASLPFPTIGQLLKARAGQCGEKPWLIFYADEGGRQEWSYAAFADLVDRTAGFLVGQGIAHGDRIATIAHNHADTVVHYFAAWTIGAVVVPVNVGEDDRRIGYILENSRTKLAFVRKEFLGRIGAICEGLKSSPVIIPTPHPLAPAPPAGLPAAGAGVGSEDEALIVYTSGTTGLPKGVVLTQANLLADAAAIAGWHGMGETQRMMCVLPIHHVNGTVVTLMTPLVSGGSVVLNERFHTRHFFERIAAEGVSVASVVPTLLQFLLHEKIDLSRLNLKGFRHIICGAGPLTVELALRFEDVFGIPIIHGYGLSETTCYSCFLPLDLSAAEHRRWLGEHGFPSIGTAIQANEMSIHDDQGREVAEGSRGEIVIRGINVMKEYYANPEANAAAFTFGWFRSGDEGFYRKDGAGRKFFFITGRIKELIIRGGVNISPFEIDEVLMHMPGVAAGLAVGFENDWYGEEVGAYVKPSPGAVVTEADVLAYCRTHFAFQKCPKVVLFGDDIPVTSTGKYQRSRLKPLFARWKDVQFTESKGHK
jgi:long-chain acyl-CoA synthetase